MQDARKVISRTMGFSTSSIPGSILPPDTREDTCPLCGHYQPLDDRGYCGTEECEENARDKARKMAREQGGDIPGLYYKLGDGSEIINFARLETWKPPQEIKHPDMCSLGECTEWKLPADYLCRHHRQAETAREYRERRAEYRKVRGPRGKRSKVRKGPKLPGNKIRGLGNIKL